MEWTVAPIDSNDPACTPMLSRCGLSPASVAVAIAARGGGRDVALHLFSPIDVLIDHARVRLLRLVASVGDGELRDGSLDATLECASACAPAQGVAGVCALIERVPTASVAPEGFHGEPLREIVFMVTRPGARRLDEAAAFDALTDGALTRFDYHALRDAAHTITPTCVERDNNLLWGTVSRDGGTFESQGCELSRPQLFPELLDALAARHRVQRVRFLCSARGILARAAAHVAMSRESSRMFLHDLRGVSPDICFDAHAGLACSRH